MLGLGIALATVLVGCGPADDPEPDGPTAGPSETGSPTQEGRTAEQIAALVAYETAVGERLAEDGTIPVDLALDMFAGSFGPVDGGDPTALGPAPGSATLAVFGILGSWDDLTEPQRSDVVAVMDAHLAEDDDADDAGDDDADAGASASDASSRHTGDVVVSDGVVSTAPVVVPAVAAVTALPGAADGQVPVEELRAWADELQADTEVLLGEDLSIPVQVVRRQRAATSDMFGVAIPLQGRSLPVDERVNGCRVVMYTRPGDSRTVLRATLAHELFHCFQFTVTTEDRFPRVPAWIVEGSAEFVAATIAPGDSQFSWDGWLANTEESLFARGNSAIGVFAVAQQSGADPWETMLPMVRTGSSRSALELLFGTEADAAMRTVARALVREPFFGTGWESVGPDITATRGTTEMAVGEGNVVESLFPMRRYATAPATVDVTGTVIDVTVVSGYGSIGIPGPTTVDVGRGFMARYCVTGFCECPDGGTVNGTEIPSDGLFAVALTTLDPLGEAGFRIAVPTHQEACENPAAGETLIIHFDRPSVFEIHGGVCTVQDTGDLLIMGGGDRMPEGYDPPPEHRDDARMWIYKTPGTRADGGSVDLTVGGAQLGGGSTINLEQDLLGGTFVLDSGYAGWWRCPELLTPDEAFAPDG